jgi:hypothetical protein
VRSAIVSGVARTIHQLELYRHAHCMVSNLIARIAGLTIPAGLRGNRQQRARMSVGVKHIGALTLRSYIRCRSTALFEAVTSVGLDVRAVSHSASIASLVCGGATVACSRCEENLFVNEAERIAKIV